MMTSTLDAVKRSLPAWLLSPQSPRDGLKIAGVATAGAYAMYSSWYIGGILKIVVRELVHDYNRYTSSYQVVRRSAVNLQNKVAIVTGGNGGIGKETVKQLFNAGCIVVMAARNVKKAQAARDDILRQLHGKGIHGDLKAENLIVMPMDLADLTRVDAFVSAFNQNAIINGELDFLINNAGVMSFPEYTTNGDGIEMQFAVNHVGHFYLTNQLLPLIKQNGTRIVTVSSVSHAHLPGIGPMEIMLKRGHEKGPQETDIAYTADGFTYYAISKLANVLFSRKLNRMYYQKHGVVALTLHPGVVSTDINQHISWGWYLYIKLSCWYFLKGVETGAATTLRCVTITEDEIFHRTNELQQLPAIPETDKEVDDMMLYFDDCRCRNDVLFAPVRDNQRTDIDGALWEYSKVIIGSLRSSSFKLNDD